jgi:hypothetical protein
MIDFNHFCEKLDEWGELTVLHTLQRTLKNRFYDRLRNFDEKAFDKAMEYLIENSIQPSYGVLKGQMILHSKKAPLRESQGHPDRNWEGPCLDRHCDTCEYEICSVVNEVFSLYFTKLLDPKTHDEALKCIRAELPEAYIKDKRPLNLIIPWKKNELGEIVKIQCKECDGQGIVMYDRDTDNPHGNQWEPCPKCNGDKHEKETENPLVSTE